MAERKLRPNVLGLLTCSLEDAHRLHLHFHDLFVRLDELVPHLHHEPEAQVCFVDGRDELMEVLRLACHQVVLTKEYPLTYSH